MAAWHSIVGMGKLVEAAEVAAKLGVSSGRLRTLCRERRVSGARCIAGRWFVPATLTSKDIKPGTRGPKMGR